jgi:hypothetical protein
MNTSARTSLTESEPVMSESTAKVSTFKIEFKTSNAAFCNPDTGEFDEFYARAEISTLLRDVEHHISRGRMSGWLIDSNGNTVGDWGWTA